MMKEVLYGKTRKKLQAGQPLLLRYSPAACRNIVSCIAEVTENSVKSYFAAVHFHKLTGLYCPGCGGTRAVYWAAERKCGIQFTLPQHCTLRSSTLCMVYAIQYRAVCKPRQNLNRHEIPSGVWQNCSGSAGGKHHMEKRKPAAVS